MISEKTKPNSVGALKKILHPIVNNWFFKKFKSFSEPQKFGIMEVHSRNNCLISAPTGGTKTLTAFTSILNELIDSSEKGILENRVYAIYISPLKALSNDVEKNLISPLREMEEMSKKKFGINITVRTGDTPTKKKSEMLKKVPHILITTPESLAIMLNAPKFKANLQKVDWVVIDEIHSLAENKRGTHLSLSLERLQRVSPGMCRIGLSATIAPLEEIAKFLVGFENGELRDCMLINVEFAKKKDFKVLSPVKDLIESKYEDTQEEMYKLLHKLIQKHITTLVFTNTRAGTERIVYNLKEKYPKFYNESNIGAHHGSLSKEHRFKIESDLKEGKLKVGVSSTSLELGIDIGFIDLVVCLGSPKSVARFLQRAGRAGHKLHETVKARLIVTDRDELIECSVLLKAAIENEIDRIHIPRNALDVLAQQIYGIVIESPIHVLDLFEMVKKSYSYHDLERDDFDEIIKYLNGDYVSLEQRYVYAKISFKEESGMIYKRGKLARVIYMTNIGTIPDQSGVVVKIKDSPIGKIDEGFLEKLSRGDIFVLGGSSYQFLFARGQSAQVQSAGGRSPTVPRWYSEMLPLSYDLAIKIQKFRSLMQERFSSKEGKENILAFINNYLYVDERAANAIFEFFHEQYLFARIPKSNEIIIETIKDDNKKYYVVHTLFGRKVNDTLSRAIGFILTKTLKTSVSVSITDNGFYLDSKKPLNVRRAFDLIQSEKMDLLMKSAIENAEILRRRFRHCASRALMIISYYKGVKKNVGRKQVSSQILMSAVKRISKNFPILKEARREVLDDAMDYDNTKKIIEDLENNKISIVEIFNEIPSPFASNIATHGYSDIMWLDDKTEFLKKIHRQVIGKISLKKNLSKMDTDFLRSKLNNQSK